MSILTISVWAGVGKQMICMSRPAAWQSMISRQSDGCQSSMSHVQWVFVPACMNDSRCRSSADPEQVNWSALFSVPFVGKVVLLNSLRVLQNFDFFTLQFDKACAAGLLYPHMGCNRSDSTSWFAERGIDVYQLWAMSDLLGQFWNQCRMCTERVHHGVNLDDYVFCWHFMSCICNINGVYVLQGLIQHVLSLHVTDRTQHCLRLMHNQVLDTCPEACCLFIRMLRSVQSFYLTMWIVWCYQFTTHKHVVLHVLTMVQVQGWPMWKGASVNNICCK